MAKSNKNNGNLNYFNFENYNALQSGLINKKDLSSFLKDVFYAEIVDGTIKVVYNLNNPDEIDYIELKGFISLRKRISDMQANKLDLILKTLIDFKEDTTKKFGEVHQMINDLDHKIDNVESRLNKRIDDLDKRIDDLDKKIDDKILEVREEFNTRMDGIDLKLTSIETRLTNIENCPTVKSELGGGGGGSGS